MDSRQTDYVLDKVGDLTRAVEGLQGTADENKTVLENIERSLDRIAEGLESLVDHFTEPATNPIVEALEALTLIVARPEDLPQPEQLPRTKLQIAREVPENALSCSEGCGGHYRRVSTGGHCDTCPNTAMWVDFAPHLQEANVALGVLEGYLVTVSLTPQED